MGPYPTLILWSSFFNCLNHLFHQSCVWDLQETHTHKFLSLFVASLHIYCNLQEEHTVIIIWMASFRLLILMPFIIAFMASPLLSLSSELKLGEAPTTISASPALMPNPPFAELSPEIAPLFPSPGGELPPPAGSNSLPTIPSNPSPPNPDELAGFAPDSAISPSGSKLASSASSLNSLGFLNSAILMVFLALW